MAADPRMAGLAPEVVATVHAGARALRDGDPRRAETLLQQACRQAPRHPEPLRYLAILQLHTRRATQAMDALQRALALVPDDALLHSDLGTAAAACGQADAALASWRRACELDPAQPTPWFNLGRNLQQRGDTDAAIAALERATALAPDMLPVQVLLGDALAHAGRFDESAARYREALRLQPACGDAWRGLSNIKTVPLDEADAAQLRAQLQRRDLAAADRVAMGSRAGQAGGGPWPLRSGLRRIPRRKRAAEAADALARAAVRTLRRGRDRRHRPACRRPWIPRWGGR